MIKEQLIQELQVAKEQLKDYKNFADLFKDENDPKAILTSLNVTIARIEKLLKASDMKEIAFPKNKPLIDPMFGKVGSLVKIRPCGKEHQNKTYLGFLIGEVALGGSINVTEDKIQLNFSNHNPAIFVPELKKLIYGNESWWSVIKSEEELKEITDYDIENVWYLKLLKTMS